MPTGGGFPSYIQSSSSGDNYNYNGVPPEIALEEQALNRKQHIANLLLQRGLAPLEGQMVGGWYVPPSPVQGLAQLASAGIGAYATNRNDKARAALSGKSNDMLSEAMQKYKASIADRQTTTTPETHGPGSPVQVAQPGQGFSPNELKQPTALYGTKQEALDKLAERRGAPFFKEGPRPTSDPSTAVTTSMPVTPDEKRQAIIEQLAMSTHPQAQKMGQFLLSELDRKESREDTQAFQKSENEQNRESRAEMSKLLLDQKGQAIAFQADSLRAQLDDKQLSRESRDRLEKRQQDNELEFKKWQTQQTVAGHKDVANIMADSRKEVQGMKSGVNRPMSATAQKELIQTEEELQGSKQAVEHLKSALALNDKALGFSGASSLAQAGSVLPDAIRPKSVDATVDLENLIQGSTLPQLKAIFGGMPTEGERKILLDVAGSTSKTPAQRKAIFERAIQGANNRIKFNSQKAEQLRGGTYFAGDGGLDTSAAPNPTSPLATPPQSGGTVAPFNDAEKERRYQEFKKNHK